MKKGLKITLFVIVILGLAFLGVRQYMINQTKKHSPEETITYSKNSTDFEVFYNRPYKKGRKIFGGIVRYGRTWRTGANEATTFETSNDITIQGKLLPKGKYTLWTVPDENSWQVIFNSKMYWWGVKSGGKASRDSSSDVVNVTIPVVEIPNVIEQFTILFRDKEDSLNLVLAWDQTEILVPLETK